MLGMETRTVVGLPVAPEAWVKVIIVEDDPSLYKVWERVFHFFPTLNYQIYNNPWDALNALERSPVQMLITDLSMPGLNGIDLIKKSLHHNPHTRIVLTSGYLNQTHELNNLGKLIHVIPKPVTNLGSLIEFLNLFFNPADDDEISLVEKKNQTGIYVWDL